MAFKKSLKTKKLLGYGEGEKENYKAAFDPPEIKGSDGSMIRFWDPIQGRDVLLLSSIERFYYLYFSFHPSVIQIKEQKSIPIEESRSIARDLGIRHPEIDGKDMLVTTDLLVETRHGTLAVAIKPSSELNNKRILEKLEIEQFFWTRHGVQWFITTELTVNEIMFKNFKLLFPLKQKDYNQLNFNQTQIDAISYFFKELNNWQKQKAHICFHLVEQTFDLPNGTFNILLLQLISNGTVKCCLSVDLDDFHNQQIELFNFYYHGFKN